MKVCQKVEEKGVTSYLEVSDELVMEQQEAEERGEPSGEHGPKNIKRRVYDALNVLMAMNIISKEKKEIRWIGLPSNLNSECEQLEKLRAEKSAELARKTANLRELLLKHIAVKNLAKRNKAQRLINPNGEAEGGISLPFLVLNTSQKAVINCQMTEDKYARRLELTSCSLPVLFFGFVSAAVACVGGSCSAQQTQSRHATRFVPPPLPRYPLVTMNGAGGTTFSISTSRTRLWTTPRSSNAWVWRLDWTAANAAPPTCKRRRPWCRKDSHTSLTTWPASSLYHRCKPCSRPHP